jgi:cytochrome c-type biogenesis protein CcmH
MVSDSGAAFSSIVCLVRSSARTTCKLIFTLLTLLIFSVAQAKDAAPAAADPQLEKRVMRLAEELRCLVCQNQTIADSNAPLAVDLREQVRDKMRKGASDDEIIDYLVARYGDFVRYRPPLKASTLLLWFGPLLLLVGAFVGLLRRLRARRAEPLDALSESDHARAAALLETGDEAR